jgi:hypothetical protein
LNPETRIEHAFFLPAACYALRVQIAEPALNWRDHIETKPEVLAGRPVVTGTRIPVELVAELPAQEWTTEEIVGQPLTEGHSGLPALRKREAEAERVCPAERATFGIHVVCQRKLTIQKGYDRMRVDPGLSGF